jgi:hypothetical protein
VYFPSLHRYPGEIPNWWAEGHAFEDLGVADPVPFERGEDRQRRRFTWAPQIVAVSTRFTQAEFDRFDEWYEQDLQAGAQRFDARVAAQGGDAVAWWAAQFVGPYTVTAQRARYLVQAQLLLLDGPYDERTAPSLQGLSEQVTLHPGRFLVDALLRGLASQVTAHPGRLSAGFTLRGLSEQVTEHPGLLAGGASSLRSEADDALASEAGESLEAGAAA